MVAAFFLGGAFGQNPFGDAVAAWVQGIGALAALYITVMENRRLARMERARLIAPLQIAVRAAAMTLHHYDGFEKGAEGRNIQDWATAHLEPGPAKFVMHAFDEVSLRDMPNVTCIDALILARNNAAFLFDRIRAAEAGRPKWAEESLATRGKLFLAWKALEDERNRLLAGRCPSEEDERLGETIRNLI